MIVMSNLKGRCFAGSSLKLNSENSEDVNSEDKLPVDYKRSRFSHILLTVGVWSLRIGSPPVVALRSLRKATFQKTVEKCTRSTREPIF